MTPADPILPNLLPSDHAPLDSGRLNRDAVASPFSRLEAREHRFAAPPALILQLEHVRQFLRDDLGEADAPCLSLLRAAIVLGAASEGTCGADRLISLASGVEMIHHALTAQQAGIRPGQAIDLFSILEHDLALARALDIYTRDGDCRVMQAGSVGAGSLCEALMAARTGEPHPVVARCLSRFYASCARVGCAGAGLTEEREAHVADAVKGIVARALASEENAGLPENSLAMSPPLLSEVLSRWLMEPQFAG